MVDIPPDGVAMLDIPTLFEITYDDYQSTTLKLRHFKETERREHEFVIADIEQWPSRYFMRVERSFEGSELPQQKLSVLFSPKPSKDTAQITMNEALLHHEANRGATGLLTSISFAPEHRPLLRKLCFVLRLINTFVSEYRVFNHQCYWFCLTIMRAVELEFKGANIKEHMDAGRAGTFLGIPVPRDEKALKWVHMGLHNLYRETFSAARTTSSSERAQSIAPSVRSLMPEPVPGSVVPDEAVERILDWGRPEAERYSWSLYPRGLGLPIWSPTPVKIGSFGFFLDGRFHYLDVNICEDGDDHLFPYAETKGAIGQPRILSSTDTHSGGVICPGKSNLKLLSPRQYDRIIEWGFEVGDDDEYNMAAFAIDPAPGSISANNPGAWLAGDRRTTVSLLAVSLIDLRLHLQNCLDRGRLDSLLRLSPSRCLFLATKTRTVDSWATTVRQAPEESMRLGVQFSEASGACVGFGWRGRHERHGRAELNADGNRSEPQSAAFMSGFYISAREFNPNQGAANLSVGHTVASGPSTSGNMPSFAAGMSNSTSDWAPSAHRSSDSYSPASVVADRIFTYTAARYVLLSDYDMDIMEMMNPTTSNKVDYGSWTDVCFSRGLGITKIDSEHSVASLTFPAPFDAVHDSYLRHPHHNIKALQEIMIRVALPQATPHLGLAGLMVTWTMARDCVMLGGITALTRLLRTDGLEGQVCASLELIVRICALAPTWRTARSIVEARTFEKLAILLVSGSSLIRATAAIAVNNVVTLLRDELSKDFSALLPVAKSLVDVLQLDSWNQEKDVSAALWALADLKYDVADVASALDRWCEGLVEEEVAGPSDTVSDDLMDYTPSVMSSSWPLENVSAADLADLYGYRIEPRLVINIQTLTKLHDNAKPTLIWETRQLIEAAVMQQQVKGNSASQLDPAGNPVSSLDADGLGDNAIDHMIRGAFVHPWTGQARTCAKLQIGLRHVLAPPHETTEVTGFVEVILHCPSPATQTFVNSLMIAPLDERLTLLSASPNPRLQSLKPCIIESDAAADTLSNLILCGAAKASIFLEQTRLQRIPIMFTNGRSWQFGIASHISRTVNVAPERTFDMMSATDEEYNHMIVLQHEWFVKAAESRGGGVYVAS